MGAAREWTDIAKTNNDGNYGRHKEDIKWSS